MRFAKDVEDAVDELWELSLDADNTEAGYVAPRRFAALVAELCAQLVESAPEGNRFALAAGVRRTFCITR